MLVVIVALVIVVNSMRGGEDPGSTASGRRLARSQQPGPSAAAGSRASQAPGADRARTGRVVLGSYLEGGQAERGSDGKGKGQATVTLTGDRLCFTIAWQRPIAPAGAAVRADASSAGVPAEAVLFDQQLPNELRGVQGCVSLADRRFADSLVDNPAGYYLELRPAPGSGQPIRGRLLPQREPVDPFRDMAGPLVALADGAQETSGPNDVDGRATGFLRLGGGQASFVVTWTRLDPPTFGHIHVGRVGTPMGRIVLPLFATSQGLPANVTGVAGVVEGVDGGLSKRINSCPAAFFLRLHNGPHPDGAVRGQFARRGSSVGAPSPPN